MQAESERGGVWPPAPNVTPPATPPNAKSGVPYLLLTELLIGLCANVFVFVWCDHVTRLYPAWPGNGIADAIFKPVFVAAFVAALVGLPLSFVGRSNGSRALSWTAVGLNVLSLFFAYFWSGITRLSWE